MTVCAVQPTPDRIRYVIDRMRQRDADEIFALHWDDNREALAEEVATYAGAMSVCWELDGVPVSLQGTAAIRPGVWANWAFGTDDWPRVVLSMTRHSRRFIMPALLRAGFHRAEARALASHTSSRAWIESLGGRLESIQTGAGRAGEDFAVYVWTPDDVRRRLQQR